MNTLKYYFIFVFVLGFILVAEAQQDDRELWQLIQKVQTTTNKAEKLATLQKLSFELATLAPTEAIGYAQEGISLAYEDYTAQAQLYLALGIANYYGEMLGKATQYLQKISKLQNVLPATQIQAWQYLALCMAREKDKANTEKYFTRAQKEAEKINDKTLLAQNALFRAECENGQQALVYYQNALSLFEALRNEVGVAKTAQAMGDFYAEQLNVPLTALYYYQKVLALADRLGNKRLMADALNGMGYVHAQKQNDLKTALRQYFQSFLVAKEYDFIQNGTKLAQSLKGIYTSYQQLAKQHRNANEAEKANEYDKLADRYHTLAQGLVRADYDVQLLNIASPEPRSYSAPAPDRPRRNFSAPTLRQMLKPDQKPLSENMRKADSLLLEEKDAQIDHWQGQSSKHEDEKLQQEAEVRKYRNWTFWGLIAMIGVLGSILGYAIYHLSLQKKLIALQKKKVQEAQEKANYSVLIAREYENTATQKNAETTEILNKLDDKHFEEISFRKTLQEDVLRNLSATSFAKQERARYALSSILQDHTPVAQNIHTQPVAPIIQQAISKVADILKEQNIKLEQNIATNLACPCDAELLENVFLHLFHNSFKYTVQGGHIRIDSNKDEKYISLTYKDNGQGVPAKMHGQVFHKFPTQEARPFALGLYQAKQLMEAQKGAVTLTPNAMGMTINLKFEATA